MDESQGRNKTWEDVLKNLRTTFAPKRPAYKIYEELVTLKRQTLKEVESFVSKKRALMAELPKPSLLESQCLDLLYALLHAKIKDKVPRDTVKTFQEFLTKARQIEDSLVDTEVVAKRERSTLFRAFGHVESECRRKINNNKNSSTTTAAAPTPSKAAATKPPPLPSKVSCYGCGEPGIV